MSPMPPPEGRGARWVFTHNQTVAGHRLVWVTYTSAGHVEVYLPTDDGEQWIANVTRLVGRWPPVIRTNCQHASWLGRDTYDRVGRDHRQTIADAAVQLWKTANYPL